jgi:flagellar biosynthetic protein FliO
VNSFLAVVIVLALVAALAWLARRGAFATLQARNRIVAVETAVPLGERRSLVVVAVEGRRLLLGLTPGQISLVAELSAAAPVATEPVKGSDLEIPAKPLTGSQSLLARFARRVRSADEQRTQNGPEV